MMLLRRVIEHVKAQNWFAVGLDFLIVVLGVFIGIQVSNWNAARQDRVQQALVETRLRDDFRVLGEELDAAHDYSRKVSEALDVLRDSLARGAARPEDDEAVKLAIRRGYSHPTFIRHSPTYGELVANGRLDLVRDELLRIALARYDEQSHNRVFNLQQNRNVIDRLDFYLPQYAELAPVDLDQGGVRPVTAYDIPAMAADAEYRADLEKLIDMQGWMHSNLVAQRRDIDAVLQVLAEQEE